MLWLVLLGIAATLANLLPAPYLAPNLPNSNVPPLTPGHWLGTDPLGQDVAATLIYGARTALLVSLPAAIISAGLGAGIGLLVGYWGNTQLRFARAYWLTVSCAVLAFTLVKAHGAGTMALWWPLVLSITAFLLGQLLLRFQLLRRTMAVPLDWLLQVAVALLAAIPRLLLVLAVAAAFKITFVSLVLLLAFTSWTQPARLVRAEVRRVGQLLYLEAARAAGLPPWQVMRYHVLPNVLQPVITGLPLSIATFIALETTLSFLGVGLPPEVPSWGRLLALSRFASSSWWLLLFPTICLLATTLSLRQLLLISKR
ncbi:ABC transporter permease [Hymenobacter sp.]|uniref:ABC transporter permease n=1 Tax=Hymenobacter sp. TaxID=1898978 RepID=UPI002EDA6C9B